MLEALLRLKFYVREGGKYLLMAFNREPSYYLPKREIGESYKAFGKLARRYLKFNASDISPAKTGLGILTEERMRVGMME